MTQAQTEAAYDAAPAAALPAKRIAEIVAHATDDGRPKRALCKSCKQKVRVQGLQQCSDCVDLEAQKRDAIDDEDDAPKCVKCGESGKPMIYSPYRGVCRVCGSREQKRDGGLTVRRPDDGEILVR